MQGRRPGHPALAVSAVNERSVAGEYLLDADQRDGFFYGIPQFVQPLAAELGDAGLPGQRVQPDREQGIIGLPPAASRSPTQRPGSMGSGLLSCR